MQTVKKYLLFVFLIENIFVQTSLMRGLTDYLFYPFLAIGLIGMLSSAVWNKISFQKFGWMYLLMLLYVVYEFTLGMDYVNQKTLLYLISKLVTFGIIIMGVGSNEEFYRSKAIRWLIFTMAFFLMYGLATGGEVREGSGRALAGYTNENTTGAMGAMIVGMLVFYLKGKKWKVLDYLLLVIGMYGVLAGASRAGFLMLFMLIFMRYGFNIKTVLLGASVFVLGLYLLPELGVETIGVQRMMNTYNGTEGNNRDLQRLAAEIMINQRPMTGWGYQAMNQGEALRLTELGSHNGYLELLKQMGIPAASCYFLIIGITLLKTIALRLRHRVKIDLFLALVLMLIVDANYEGLYVGVHEYATNIFFFALAMVTAQNYKLNRE